MFFLWKLGSDIYFVTLLIFIKLLVLWCNFPKSKRWSSRCNICCCEYNNTLIQWEQMQQLWGLVSGGNYLGKNHPVHIPWANMSTNGNLFVIFMYIQQSRVTLKQCFCSVDIKISFKEFYSYMNICIIIL